MQSIYGQYLPVSVPQMINELTTLKQNKEQLLETLLVLHKDLADALTYNKMGLSVTDKLATCLASIELTLDQYEK
jgi:hypothetical protein